MPEGWSLGANCRPRRFRVRRRTHRTSPRLLGSQRPGTRYTCDESGLRVDAPPQRAAFKRTDAVRDRRRGALERGDCMKITDVQLYVLKSEGLYNNPDSAEEQTGPGYMGVVR